MPPSTQTPFVSLETPRIQRGLPLLIAGLRGSFTADTLDRIPAQWECLAPHLGKIPGQLGDVAYGVVFNSDRCDTGIDYLCGVEVADVSQLEPTWSHIEIAPQNYVVFAHRMHVSTLRQTVHTILHQWLPATGHPIHHANADAPDFFERYSEDFNPQTGHGGMEIWLPIGP